MKLVLLFAVLFPATVFADSIHDLNRADFISDSNDFEYAGDDGRDNRILVDEYNAFLPEISNVPKPDATGSCGGIYREEDGKIASPNYPTSEYPPNTNCTWVLEVEQGKLMNLKFAYMDAEVGPPDCPFDGVVLLDYGKIAKPGDYENIVEKGIIDSISVPPTVLGGTKFCGNGSEVALKSISNTVFVYFYSDFSSNGGGFVLEWTTVDTPDDEYDCDFENGLCPGWVNPTTDEDNFDWDIGQGQTMVEGTGPSVDHTLQDPDGKYVFIQALLQKENETAILLSPEILFKPTQDFMCLEFWYNMYGKDVNTLAVGLGVGDERRVQWMQRGNQGDEWKQQTIEITNIKEPFRLIFVGITGAGEAGDIALDDIVLHRTDCEQIDSTVETTTSFDYYNYGTTTDSMPDYTEMTSESYTTEATADQTTDMTTESEATTHVTTESEATTDVTTVEDVTEETTYSEETTVEVTTEEHTTFEATTVPEAVFATTEDMTTDTPTTIEQTTESYVEETTAVTTTTTLPTTTTESYVEETTAVTTTKMPTTTSLASAKSTVSSDATITTQAVTSSHTSTVPQTVRSSARPVFTWPVEFESTESVTTEEATTEDMFFEVTTQMSSATTEGEDEPIEESITVKAILESTRKMVTAAPESADETTSSALCNAKYSAFATVVSLMVAILIL